MADLRKRRTKIFSKGLFMMVLAPSKTGKSHFMGTYPGEGNILHLHGSGETHGSLSAEKEAGDRLISVQWKTGGDLIKDLKEILSPATIKENNITCIGLDSLTELFRDIKETKAFQQKCMTSSGKHNSFKESEALIELMSKIISWLRALYNEHQVSVVCAMHARVTKTEHGEVSEVKPDLPGFGVAEFLVGQFDDILVMSRNPQTNKPEFVCSAVGKRTSKDDTGEVTRYLDFTPCLQHVAELPDRIPATIPELLKLKGVSTDK